MIYLIIASIILVLVLSIICFIGTKKKYDFDMIFIICLMFGVIYIISCYAFFSSSVFNKKEIIKEYDSIDTTHIVSLKDNLSVRGSFFLGSGIISNTMKYVFYIKNYDGSYSSQMIDADDVRIMYAKNNPRIEVTKHITEYREKNVVENDILTRDSYVVSKIIYVPEGSIKNNFELDAQ